MSLDITNYDITTLKSDLIKFLQTDSQFSDFDYQGSTINTIIDLLVRNTYYTAYMGNMVATESFLDSAMIRENVVSHAQKLSYKPKSRTAVTVIGTLSINTDGVDSYQSITVPKNTAFTKKIDNISYRFVTTSSYEAVYNSNTGLYEVEDCVLKQGTLVTEQVTYTGTDLTLSNKNADTSTLKVRVSKSNETVLTEYNTPDHIITTDKTQNNYFLYENTKGTFTLQFGKDILGVEPSVGDIVNLEYVVVEDNHANGISEVVCTGSVSGFKDVEFLVLTAGYGGSEKADIDAIKFVAPKIYKSQRRAVNAEDYQALILELFPFIKSCNVWSGADNLIPDNGSIYISCTADESYDISDSVKDAIQTELNKYKVGVTRVNIIDPVAIKVNLAITVYYNDEDTSQSFTDIQTQILKNISEYESNYLNIFNGTFNHQTLVKNLLSETDVSIVDIEKEIYQTNYSDENATSVFDYEFGNKLEKGSVRNSSGTITDSDGSIYKDGSVIGAADYTTGVISFKTYHDSAEGLDIFAKTESDNIFSKNNIIIQIGDISITRGVL